MTNDEAKLVAAVVATADNCCVVCAEKLANELATALPGHDWRQLVSEAGDWHWHERGPA